MFWGQYSHCIDDKGRLIIPARYRPHLCDGAFLTRGFDQNLVIYPVESWQQVKKQIDAMAITDANGRAIRRLLFSCAVDFTLDRQGRLLIPTYLREYANLNDDVVVVGMEHYIEIWNPSQWQDTLNRASFDLDKSDNSLNFSA